MPLNSATLASDLADIAANPPATVAGCAAAWAEAIGSYASNVVPPSTAAAAAQATLESALVGAFGSPAAAPLMEVAFLAFGVTLGLGMAPAFVAVPPSAPVGLVAQFAGPKPATHEAAGAAIAALIDTWMKTGTATPIAPPGAPPIFWT